jgi:hypothetical protein
MGAIASLFSSIAEMNKTELIAQSLGIIGLIIIVWSFQCKKNRNFFIMQGTGSFMFFLNFLLIGAIGGALFNLANLVRGLLFADGKKKKWKLCVVEAAYTVCFAVSVILDHSARNVFLVALPFSALIIMSIFMYVGNPKRIRYFQIAYMSPTWIFHNIFNFSLGGIICECFNMVSSFIYLAREKKSNRK